MFCNYIKILGIGYLSFCFFLSCQKPSLNQQQSSFYNSNKTDSKANYQPKSKDIPLLALDKFFSPEEYKNCPNPFLLPEEKRLIENTLEEKLTGYNLSAIVISGKDKYALINGRIVKEGDKLAGKKIKLITRNRVFFWDEVKKQTYYLDLNNLTLSE